MRIHTKFSPIGKYECRQCGHVDVESSVVGFLEVADDLYRCPHCGDNNAIKPLGLDYNGLPINYQCKECDGEGNYDCPHCGQDMQCEECEGFGLDADVVDIKAWNAALSKAVSDNHKSSSWDLRDRHGNVIGRQSDNWKLYYASFPAQP